MNLTVGALAVGTRRFLRSPVTWLLALLGALFGFFLFCHPLLGTGFFSAGGPPAWQVCTVITIVNAGNPFLVLWVAFVVREALRKV
jgi:hypothetical protein